MIALAMMVALTAQSGGALVYGGEISCARWQSTTSYQQAGRSWILGFWSGKNMEAADNSQVGRTTDADGIVGEVKLVCDAAPSKMLVTATLETYQRFKRENR